MITIVLAEYQKLIREGLRALLQSEEDFEIIGETDDGLDVIQLVQKLKPDVLILDLIMPGLNGLELARRLRQHSPQTRIVMLCFYGNEEYVLEAWRRGINAWVSKNSSAIDLVNAVREAKLGNHYFDSSLSESVLNEHRRISHGGIQDPYEKLTNREREILQLLAEGHNMPQIASRLSIGRRTVETHRNNIMKKLGLNTLADLIRYALTRGIIPPN